MQAEATRRGEVAPSGRGLKQTNSCGNDVLQIDAEQFLIHGQKNRTSKQSTMDENAISRLTCPEIPYRTLHSVKHLYPCQTQDRVSPTRRGTLRLPAELVVYAHFATSASSGPAGSSDAARLHW